MVGCGWLWLVVLGCGGLWLVVVGCGWLWWVVVGCGWLWLVVVGQMLAVSSCARSDLEGIWLHKTSPWRIHCFWLQKLDVWPADVFIYSSNERGLKKKNVSRLPLTLCGRLTSVAPAVSVPASALWSSLAFDNVACCSICKIAHSKGSERMEWKAAWFPWVPGPGVAVSICT